MFITLNTANSCKNKKTIDKDQAAIFLVRHAEKGDDGTKDPPLTEEGQKRALKLADMLEEKGITKIYSTDFNRTRGTAEPLAERLKLSVTIYDPGDKDFASKVAEELSEGSILIVGHSNSTPTLVNKVIGEEKFEQINEEDYGNLFTIMKKGSKLQSKVQIY